MSVMRSSDGFELVLTRLRASSAPSVFGMTYPRSDLRVVARMPPITLLAQFDLMGLQVIAVHLDAETRPQRELEATVRNIERLVDKMIVLAQIPLRRFELVEVRN